MLTLIVITSLSQLLPMAEQEFNITLPGEDTTTTPEPIIFIDDSSGESSGVMPFPKKAKSPKKKGKSPGPKQGKLPKTKNGKSSKNGINHLNSSAEFQANYSTNTFLMAGGISLVCLGILAMVYKARQRWNGYEKINPGSVNNYGSLGNGTW